MSHTHSKEMRDPTPAPPFDPPSPASVRFPATTPTHRPKPLTTSSSLSPHAQPFFPSLIGHSKIQRWKDSPLESDGDQAIETNRRSYRDADATGVFTVEGQGQTTQLQASPPPQPARIRLCSEIHRVSDAAEDEESWRVVRSRRSRRSRHPSSRVIAPSIVAGRNHVQGAKHTTTTCKI